MTARRWSAEKMVPVIADRVFEHCCMAFMVLLGAPPGLAMEKHTGEKHLPGAKVLKAGVAVNQPPPDADND